MKVYPSEWVELADKVLAKGKISFVIGATDTGKTTLAMFLANSAFEKGKRTAVIDTDIGQSNIGPPTTIGLAFVDRKVIRLSELSHHSLCFVGNTCPERDLTSMVIGTKKMAERALYFGAQKIIIDTTGLVSGAIGKELKRKKITSIIPDHIIFLERESELEHIVARLPQKFSSRIHRLGPPPAVRSKTQIERKKYRQEKFKSYFDKSKVIQLGLKEIRFSQPALREGRKLKKQETDFISEQIYDVVLYGRYHADSLLIFSVNPVQENVLRQLRTKMSLKKIFAYSPRDSQNLLVGLAEKKDELLGLGIIRKIGFDKGFVKLITPVQGQTKEIQLSQFHLDSRTFTEIR